MAGRPHIVLLGDSIFDNAAYTRGEPDVAAHLRAMVGPEWRVTNSAIDGSTTAGIARQVAALPGDATHLAVAVGGNDALGNSDLLDTPVRSTAEALRLFDIRAAAFRRAYRDALERIAARRLPTAVCTIYEGDFDAEQARLVRVGLAVFNDVILRVALELNLTIVELRLVCTDRADYFNVIEPSGRGGRKIAAAVARALVAAAADAPGTRVVS